MSILRFDLHFITALCSDIGTGSYFEKCFYQIRINLMGIMLTRDIIEYFTVGPVVMHKIFINKKLVYIYSGTCI